jgi:hypothetical protein
LGPLHKNAGELLEYAELPVVILPDTIVSFLGLNAALLYEFYFELSISLGLPLLLGDQSDRNVHGILKPLTQNLRWSLEGLAGPCPTESMSCPFHTILSR